MGWQTFFATHGQWIAGALAGLAAAIGIIASVASNQLAESSNAQLTRAAAIIERLDQQVATVIGDEWPTLSNDEIEKLRLALVALPFKGKAQIMYQNAYGKAFTQSISTAFRAGQWDVDFRTGSGFGQGVYVGWGNSGRTVLKALSIVIDSDVLHEQPGFENSEDRFVIIGVGSKPPKR